jgi:glycosyltransferase involved in cell wall biosynthesis
MHVLIAAADDPLNIKSWSGTSFQVVQQLKHHFNKVTILHYKKPKRTLFNALLRLILGPRRYPLWMTDAALREYGRELDRAIEEAKPDFVFSISSQGLIYSNLSVPTFLFSDAPWFTWKTCYSQFEPMPLLGSKYRDLEARAAQSITAAIFGTHWAAGEAQKLYGIDASRIGAVALGANWFPSLSEEELRVVIAKRGQGSIRLLFVGRDWVRKGGPDALRVASAIHKLGYAVILNVVGCSPVIDPADAGLVKVHGLLYRDNPEQKKILENLYLHSDFLITPTRAECFGLSFAEAQAFALPPISYKIQAIPEVVIDGESGLLFDVGVPPEVIAKSIIDLHSNRNRYQSIALNARSRFLNILNWNSFGESVSRFVRDLT